KRVAVRIRAAFIAGTSFLLWSVRCILGSRFQRGKAHPGQRSDRIGQRSRKRSPRNDLAQLLSLAPRQGELSLGLVAEHDPESPGIAGDDLADAGEVDQVAAV